MAKEEEKAPKEEEEVPEAGSTGVKREPGSEGGELGGPRGGAGETSEASTGWQSRLRLFTHLEAPAGGGGACCAQAWTTQYATGQCQLKDRACATATAQAGEPATLPAASVDAPNLNVFLAHPRHFPNGRSLRSQPL